MIKCSDAMPCGEERRDHCAPNTTGSTGYKDNAGRGFSHGVLRTRRYLMLRFGDASSGKAIRLPYHTLSTILTARDASGRLSRLMAASSPGAFIAPHKARQLRSAPLPPSSAIHSADAGQ